MGFLPPDKSKGFPSKDTHLFGACAQRRPPGEPISLPGRPTLRQKTQRSTPCPGLGKPSDRFRAGNPMARSSREDRNKGTNFFSVVYFSRGTLPGGRRWELRFPFDGSEFVF